jgi:hypothetical protein
MTAIIALNAGFAIEKEKVGGTEGRGDFHVLDCPRYRRLVIIFSLRKGCELKLTCWCLPARKASGTRVGPRWCACSEVVLTPPSQLGSIPS